jgi:hypothetical protein
MYATLVLGICIVVLLCYPLPGELSHLCVYVVTYMRLKRGFMLEFLPGKRALAIGLCVYHSVVSTVLFQSPRFIPYSFGAFFEASVIWLLVLRTHEHTRKLIPLCVI